MLDSNTTALPAQTRFDSTSSLNSSHTSNPPAPYLPTEILRGIVINSDLKTIAAFRGVSKKLRDIVDDLNMVDLEQILENGAHQYHKDVIAGRATFDTAKVCTNPHHTIVPLETAEQFNKTAIPKVIQLRKVQAKYKSNPQLEKNIQTMEGKVIDRRFEKAFFECSSCSSTEFINRMLEDQLNSMSAERMNNQLAKLEQLSNFLS